MAKKINTEDKPLTDDAYDTTKTALSDGTTPAESGQSETPHPIQSKKPEEKNREGAQTAEPRMLELLKKFPSYAALYIDAHGGTFSPDTPASIRGDAKLYQNPYYNELNTQV